MFSVIGRVVQLAHNNSDINVARVERKGEFYTMLSDIEGELAYYHDCFAGKTVYCNCDDPFESKFFEYFVRSFNDLGLRRLIATCYAAPYQSDDGIRRKTAYKADITEVDGCGIDGLFALSGNSLSILEGDGDYRSDECLGLLEESDIVVTNPPFGLFRDYMSLLNRYGVDFIVLGSVNAITYQDFFPLIMDGRVRMGVTIHSGDRMFWVPDDYPMDASGCGIDSDTGRRYIRVKGVRWWTTFDHGHYPEPISLNRRYDQDTYPRYDNYDAIEVSRVVDIPCDYDGNMGVPITFMDKHNPEQFEIIGLIDRCNSSGLRTKKYTIEDSPRYNDLNARSCLRLPDGGYKVVYARIVIRNLHPECY